MNCTEFEERLQHALDEGRTLDAADLADHAAHCAACRTVWDEFRTLADAVVLWRAQVPQVDLADEVSRTLQASGTLVAPVTRLKPASRSRRSLFAALSGLAA